jgi:isopentenyl-diphosphate delta-isomerase
MNTAPVPVSFADELLILVDDEDREVGHTNKLGAHQGDGLLHRAFSIFLFDGPDRVLLQQRAAEKPLWPGFWSNSVCSHPRQGETYERATERRLFEELGTEAPLHRVYRFKYQASFGDAGAEHELCTVYIGNRSANAVIAPHHEEVQDWDWFDCKKVDHWTRDEPDVFTPWFLMEWRALREQYASDVRHYLSLTG